MFETQTLFEPNRRDDGFCQYRIPNLIVSKKGTVFAFASEKVNSIADEAKGNFVLRRSFDGGRTFQPREMLRGDPSPRISYGYGGGVADLETGRVLVFFSCGVVILPGDIGGVWPEKWKAEHPEEAEELRRRIAPDVQPGRYLIWTDDEGETWSEPLAVGPFEFTNPVSGETRKFGSQWVGIQLRHGPHAGRLVIPGRGRTAAAPFDLYAYSHNCVVLSDDHGRTWRLGGLTQTGMGEACVVEEADGTVYVNSRNESLRFRGYRAWDRSFDGGESFQQSGYDTALPEPHCQASMVRYSGPPDGPSRVLFCNPAVHSDTHTHFDIEGRRRLTLRLSEDECRTWPVSRVVCEGGAAYSSLGVTTDGEILCAYETVGPVDGRLTHSGSVILARMSLDWLMEGGRAEG